MNFDFL
ncbi:hypothetical protein VCHC57A1_3522, partial [Vibrio cholerae HC-57A1]